jgi:hypothetical protein
MVIIVAFLLGRFGFMVSRFYGRQLNGFMVLGRFRLILLRTLVGDLERPVVRLVVGFGIFRV